LGLCVQACFGGADDGDPRLPDGRAGEILARAIDAAGGWERWRSVRDVAFVTTLTILDPFRNVSSESLGWYMAPLHDGMRARMQSIGMTTEITFGVDGAETWIVRDGQRIDDPARLGLTRFDLVSNLFWFSLPFSLAEMPATVTALEEHREEGHTYDRLKAEFAEANPAVPGEWFVLYIDRETGLIDRVHARLTAPFLRHTLWVGRWREYRDCGGLKKERQRQFFPADDEGSIVGNVVAEQLIEHVRLNSGFPREHFDRPPARVPAQPAAWPPPARPGRREVLELRRLRPAAAASSMP
jgi:hypothetical protein